jgi:TolB-like protein/DNA-binding winged helix-turn-helix (wHTH) protein/Flp pilus assembly protein TadD
MPTKPIGLRQSIAFGEDFELDLRPRRLRHGSRVLKLERIPLEILLLLLDHPGEVVTREEIVARIWGKDVFLDTDNSIRGAIRKIRQVLRDDPEAPRFIQTVTGRGYRFIAPAVGRPEDNSTSTVVSAPKEENEPEAEASVPPQGDRAPGILRSVRWLVLGLAAGLALALAIVYVVRKNRHTDATPPKIRSLAVLPLKNLSGDQAQEYLADGMTEELIGRLAGIRDLRVVSRTSVMRFKDTQLAVPEIARTLGVDAVVEGSVMREGSRVRVHAQLIRAATDQHIWSESYDRELRSVLGLESDVAESIAEKVKVTISRQEHSRLVAARDVSPEVYADYLRGRFSLNKETRSDCEESIHYFEQAIRTDPTFAPAYIGLGEAYGQLSSVLVGDRPREFRPKAIDAARKALELDPELAEAHVLLGTMYQKQWRWPDAEKEFKTALDLTPNDANAHVGFANFLLSQGQIDEALNWAKRGRELDPAAVSAADLAWILFFARRYEDAERELRATLAVEPDRTTALWDLGFVLIADGRAGEAIPVLEKDLVVSHGSPGVKGVLVRAYASAGRRKDALHLLDELKQEQRKGYVPAAAFIQAYIGLDNDQAFAWLNKGYEEQSAIMQWLKVEPTFDPLRRDPRFTELMRRIGLQDETGQLGR